MLQPGAEIRNPLRRNDGQLVAAGLGRFTQRHTERNAGIVCRRHVRAAGMDHQHRRCHQLVEIEPHDAGRHHSEFREHRVTPADARLPVCDVAETIAFALFLQARTEIGDGDKMRSSALADLRFRAIEKIVLQHVRLERAAGLAGHDE